MKLCTSLRRSFGTYQTIQHVKKFYKNVTLEDFASAPYAHQKYIIKLDGRNVKTPNKNVLASNSF